MRQSARLWLEFTTCYLWCFAKPFIKVPCHIHRRNVSVGPNKPVNHMRYDFSVVMCSPCLWEYSIWPAHFCGLYNFGSGTLVKVARCDFWQYGSSLWFSHGFGYVYSEEFYHHCHRVSNAEVKTGGWVKTPGLDSSTKTQQKLTDWSTHKICHRV